MKAILLYQHQRHHQNRSTLWQDMVEDLYRLSLNPTKQYDARNLIVLSDDLRLTLVEGSVFVDAFFAGEGANSQAFAMDYYQAFNRPPNVVDALTWDTIRMLSIAVVQGGSSREQIRDELTAVQIPDPVAGGGHFAANREIERGLQILTVHRIRGIESWKAPEDQLPPAGVEPVKSQHSDPDSPP